MLVRTTAALLPGEFIAIAEDAGLIVKIGKMVLYEACRQGQEWIESGVLGPDSTIGVNLSARQFSQPDLVDDVTRVLADTGLEPRQLVLEVTETVLMDDVEDAVQRLDMLSELGVRIAVDDFGTGYSSLAYLRRFPVDLLKIDRSFILKLLVSTTDAAIVNAIVSLAQSLGIRSVAEGVETDEQLTYLKHLGCNQAQGHLISHALPAPRMTDVIRRFTP